MIGSGKVIDLGENGSHEIMFFGKDESPKGFLLRKHHLILQLFGLKRQPKEYQASHRF